ncbi:MAG: hypothetical protein [Bacteriophage sp.]|nr:MAG: hypothetical protein [Bacteriophage sp.]
MIFNDVLKLLKGATNLPIRFINNDKVERCIIYKITPISDDGIKRQDRLEIQIVGFDIAEVELEDAKIRKSLLSFGDRIDSFLSIELNGGGMMGGSFEKDTNIESLRKFSFYVITTKSEV